MKALIRIIGSVLIFISANCFWMLSYTSSIYPVLILGLLFVLINVFPSVSNRRVPTLRLRVCADGAELLILFLVTTVMSVIYHIVAAFLLFPAQWTTWVFSALIAIGVESIVFWNGIMRVYCTSLQLGIRLRIIGVLCGLIPIANICVLCLIIHTAAQEVSFESEKISLNKARHDQQICRTKYPLLLVHGVFFRDFKYLNYWGRVPAELEKNGAEIHYGNHQSAASVPDSANELAVRIKTLAATTGCEKVNIIAHSKGGLDCRYAISRLGAAPYVASLTTINTPHRGCIFAEYLLGKCPEKVLHFVAARYEGAMRKFGDRNPSFTMAVKGITVSACKEFNEMAPDMPGIYYQSVGSKLVRATDAKFPLNFTHSLVKHFDGINDGLVSETSFPWGEDYTFLKPAGSRGISHGDMIDLNRENIPGFDVREFYVGLVSKLRMKGL